MEFPKPLVYISAAAPVVYTIFFLGVILPYENKEKEKEAERKGQMFCYCTERLVECALKTPPDAGIELADGGVAGPCYNGHFVECEDANTCECDCAPTPKPSYEEDDAGL